MRLASSLAAAVAGVEERRLARAAASSPTHGADHPVAGDLGLPSVWGAANVPVLGASSSAADDVVARTSVSGAASSPPPGADCAVAGDVGLPSVSGAANAPPPGADSSASGDLGQPPVRVPRARILNSGVWLSLAAAVASLAVGCTAPDAEIDSTLRGDLAFAAGDYEEALAEYRLALIQAGGEDTGLMLRLAHSYAASGRADQAARQYEALVGLDSVYGDQAVADLMRIASTARESDDPFAMARAVDAALKIRPGLGLGPPPLELARHYYRNGAFGLALPFYHMTIAESPDSIPEVVFEVGRAHEEIGDCRNALAYFERFREMVHPRDRGEVDWFIGRCAFNRAREIMDQDDPQRDLEEALRLLERVTEVEEPRNLLAEAWFEMGVILSDLTRCDEAMEAYSRVSGVDPGGSFAERAQSNFDRIRFGGASLAEVLGRCH